jgi:hypothetical protein
MQDDQKKSGYCPGNILLFLLLFFLQHILANTPYVVINVHSRF